MFPGKLKRAVPQRRAHGKRGAKKMPSRKARDAGCRKTYFLRVASEGRGPVRSVVAGFTAVHRLASLFTFGSLTATPWRPPDARFPPVPLIVIVSTGFAVRSVVAGFTSVHRLASLFTFGSLAASRLCPLGTRFPPVPVGRGVCGFAANSTRSSKKWRSPLF